MAVSAAALGASALVTVVLPSASAFAADTASINGATTFQTIDGFGSSEAFGQAASVMKTSASEQQQVFNLLYSTTSGAGLDILRNEISADSGTTIEPNAPSSPAATPSYVPLSSINQDQGQLWFAQQIKASYGVTTVFADAWSAPAFMKTNNSATNGGALCGVPGASCSSGDWRQAYANYLVQYAKDYAAAGVPLAYVGPENEANLSVSYDSMQLSPSQTAKFLDVLGPTVAASGLSAKVECCATEGWDFAQQYAAAIEADATATSNTPLFTSHGYTQAPNSPLAGWSKRAWETEWFHFDNNGWDTAWDDGSGNDGLTWAQNIYTGLTSANLNAFLFWYGTNTPDIGGNGSFLMLQNDGTVSVSSRLWAFANYSRFIRPGAMRIGAGTSSSSVKLSAYKNADGSLAIVALNTGSNADPITYALSGTATPNGATVTPYLTNASNNTAAQATTSVSGGAFSATIPARSLVTYVIPAGGTGNTVTVASPGNQAGTVGTATSLQLHASDSASGQALTYSATGLPAGLVLNAASGLISGTPSAAGTYTVTATATDTTGAAGSAVFTWTIRSSGGGTCHVTYTKNSEWAGGFTAQVVIANTGTTTINGWSLTFTFPGDQHVTSNFNGGFSQAGQNATLTNASYNATIAAGGSVSVGFQGTWTSNDNSPTTFTLNGVPCTTG
jgi:O-glycosyl hydrolase